MPHRRVSVGYLFPLARVEPPFLRPQRSLHNVRPHRLCRVRSETALYLCVALIGLGNSNVFSITLTQALQSCPEYKNEVSGLMIMGLFGGTVFPLAMSMASDGIGSQLGAVAVMLVAAAYLLFFAFKIQGKR